MSTLYIVATPIGNLEDITLRALRILREVPLIAVEDTRTTGVLLHHYSISTRMISFHDFSAEQKVAQLCQHLQSADLALVSDAGTPTISDPGYELINAVLAAGHTICPIPGPNAAITALCASGLPTDSFLFLGFLPRQGKARQARLQALVTMPHTLILYESPHRLVALLEDLAAIFANRPICVAREVTKRFETFWRGTPQEGIQQFGSADKVRGELTILVQGAEEKTPLWSAEAVWSALQSDIAQGYAKKEAAQRVAERTGWRKKELYDWLVHGREAVPPT